MELKTKERPLTKEPNVNVAPSLENALLYKNENVVRKFMENYSVNFEEATMIFTETKKWLWLCAFCNYLRSENKEFVNLVIDDSMIILDEMWHTFILFTRDYSEFCTQHFGFFIHHLPTTYSEKKNSISEKKRNPEEFKSKMIERTKKQYSFIYDHLGEETLATWYRHFPKEYSKAKIKEIKR